MDPVHSVQFVSCEDTLLKRSLFGSLSSLSIHNVACSITGIVILAYVPWSAARTAARAMVLQPATKLKTSSSSPSSEIECVLHVTRNKPEVTAYLLALTYLFFANLYQHLTGTLYWDLDVGGAIHSIFLSLMVYEECKHILSQDFAFMPQLRTSVTRSLAFLATFVELLTPVITPKHVGRKIAATIGAVASFTVVPSLGM